MEVFSSCVPQMALWEILQDNWVRFCSDITASLSADLAVREAKLLKLSQSTEVVAKQIQTATEAYEEAMHELTKARDQLEFDRHVLTIAQEKLKRDTEDLKREEIEIFSGQRSTATQTSPSWGWDDEWSD